MKKINFTPYKSFRFMKDLRKVFIPLNFREKYSYLGAVPFEWSEDVFDAVYPLVLAMDYQARPKWCPRFFLRLLHLLGNGNSVYWVKNRYFHNLHLELTKGIFITDYKTKWTDYDLRISIRGTEKLQILAEAIEDSTYRDGRKKYLMEQIQKLSPGFSVHDTSVKGLEKIHRTLLEVSEPKISSANKDMD